MTLTKAELVKQLTKNIKTLSKQDTVLFVECFFEVINSALEKGSSVKLSGFGIFHLRTKKARPARNPRTGETKTVSARKVVVFQPSQKLKTDLKKAKK